MVQVDAALGLTEQFFVTRERGEHAYQVFLQHMREISDGYALLLRFPANQLLDSSFADETIVRLGEALMEGTFGERGLLIAGLTDDSLHNLEATIRYRGAKLALIAITDTGGWRLIGKLEPSLRETLELIVQQGTMTAPELARHLNLAINTASTRLKRLHALHLVWREYAVSQKGLEYTYHFWQWTG
jgi:hypothetical protein